MHGKDAKNCRKNGGRLHNALTFTKSNNFPKRVNGWQRLPSNVFAAKACAQTVASSRITPIAIAFPIWSYLSVNKDELKTKI